MHDLVLGSMRKASRDLAGDRPGKVLLERAFAIDSILQRFSIEKLHSQVDPTFMNAVVIRRHDVGMAELGDNPRLQLTSTGNAGAIETPQVNGFQRDNAVEPLLSSAIHNPNGT